MSEACTIRQKWQCVLVLNEIFLSAKASTVSLLSEFTCSVDNSKLRLALSTTRDYANTHINFKTQLMKINKRPYSEMSDEGSDHYFSGSVVLPSSRDPHG